jgi:DNA-binding cell septation regulator SpoVG
MVITKVKIRLMDKPRLKAIASITLDNELTINDIKVIKTGKRLCSEFPKHQFAKNNNLEYIVPLNKDIRRMIESNILDEYAKMIRDNRTLKYQKKTG